MGKVGEGDTGPVTERELEVAHDMIREKLVARFASFRKAFRAVDEDNSGRVSKIEALRMLMMMNPTVREKVLGQLVNLMDKDGNGVDYDE